MKIAILSSKAKLYSTQRLVLAAKERGHEVRVIDTLRCYMNISAHHPAIRYKGKVLEKFDAVIPRFGASLTSYGAAVLRQFEMMGVLVLNNATAITRARDKLYALQLLSREGIDLPNTGFADAPDDIQDLIRMVGGAPLVVKLLQGSQGIGVALSETHKAAESVIQAFLGMKTNILVQEYIKEAQGSDIRCFVIGTKVAAAVKRQAPEGEFRSNLHRGGAASPVKITSAERKLALRAAGIIGLDIAGVDILRSDRGPLVMEVNASPGLEGIENATGMDIAGLMIEHLERRIKTAKTR